MGAEVIAGSTRLKAGTATKLVLNMLTTGAMVRIGKTYGNLMVDVQTGSEKLKDRARRIVNIVTGLEYDDADRLLKRAQWNVKVAIVMQKTGLSYLKALSRLRKAHDSMREALGEDIEPRLRGMLQGHAEAASLNGAPHGKTRSARVARQKRARQQTERPRVERADSLQRDIVRTRRCPPRKAAIDATRPRDPDKGRRFGGTAGTRRGTLRGQWPLHHSLDGGGFVAPVATSTIVTDSQDRPHPHGERLRRHVGELAAERGALWRLVSSCKPRMRSGHERRRRAR